MKASEYNISNEKFVLVGQNRKIHDVELATKPVSYFADAFSRFKRNKGSIVAAIIIIILVLFSIIGPWTTPYKVSSKDEYYGYCLPKNKLFTNMGIDLWDGCKNVSLSKESFYYYYSMGVESGDNAIKNQEFETVEELYFGRKTVSYKFRYDTYAAVGMKYMNLTVQQYKDIQDYQDKTGIQVIYPMIDQELKPTAPADATDANFWYLTTQENGKTVAVVTLDSNGAPIFEEAYQ